MHYAVFKTGGKQYKVSAGDVLDVEKLPLKKGSQHLLKDVLLYVNKEIVKIGTPLVAGVCVKVKVLDSVKSGKIRVAKFKSKVRYRRVSGHRQNITRLMVEDIMPEENLELQDTSSKKRSVRKTEDK
ncbi:MAG: 50S ribosomal protein L21 [Patescibacteria group bacterium]|nr:50S ribosomal protein L21 [Patescibacteria group bacterium]